MSRLGKLLLDLVKTINSWLLTTLLTLHLLGAGQVVVYGGGLDGDAPLQHQPGLPLPLTGVLVRVVTTPSQDMLHDGSSW